VAAPKGTALNVQGKVTFSNSGIATVAANTDSITVSPAPVTTSSMVLATIQELASGSRNERVTCIGPMTSLWLACVLGGRARVVRAFDGEEDVGAAVEHAWLLGEFFFPVEELLPDLWVGGQVADCVGWA
jgi:hypothetical protein